jgi:phosphoribosyl 1,2-cyclic phosphate phosphodiesterase
MSYRLTILGCGASWGVPRVGNDWGQCDPTNPKNRRRRCALLVEQRGPRGVTTVLVDTGPDLREQLLSVRLQAVDGVLYTHDHADHTHGIDDLRGLAYTMKRRVPVWFDAATRDTLVTRFAYCFATPPGGSYPPILEAHDIEPSRPFDIAGPGGVVKVTPILQNHAGGYTLGFRIGNFAYSPDISGIPEASLPLLEGLDLWIVDALRHMPHPSHFSVKQALEWAGRLKVKRMILTHLTAELDYEGLKRDLPPFAEPAYDNMVVELA